MITYKLLKDITCDDKIYAVLRSGKDTVPFSTENRDYVRFKKQITEETAELQDADGNVMSAEEAKAYIATLPA